MCFAGCTAPAPELAAAFGDEIALRARLALIDPGNPRELVRVLSRVASTRQPGHDRIGAGLSAAVSGRRLVAAHARTNRETARLFIRRLGLGERVGRGVDHVHFRWDGKGIPATLSGSRIDLSARIALVAGDLLVLQAVHGRERAVSTLRSRAGRAYDPAVVATLLTSIDELVGAAYSGSAWERVIAVAPERDAVLNGAAVDNALTVLADFSDATAPFLAGRSRTVASRAGAAMQALGASADDVATTKRAGLLHDLGRVAVPSSIWLKPDLLTELEWERVRLHPYQTERLLGRSRPLDDVALIAAAHHERCDGSGYFRASTRAELPLAARVLAAADAYLSMRSPRPYRPALSAESATATLRRAAETGELDSRAVEAVLAVEPPAGYAAAARPDGLTDVEVRMVRRLADGDTSRIVIHYLPGIAAKTGVSTRGAARVYAAEHGLLA